MFQQIKKAIHHYDPYGFMQVSAIQAVVITVVLFFVNFFFTPFVFSSALQLPIIGIFTTALEKNFDLRIRNVIVYCLMCALYSFILSTIIQYRALTVFISGAIVFGLFMLCKKKYPFILGMITLMQVVVYTQLRIDYGGNFTILLNYGLSFLLATAIGVIIMYLYPRVYFYRVWLKTLAYTLNEFADNFTGLATKKSTVDSLSFMHFFQMYEHTVSLGYKEHGFRARKLALRVTNIYSHLIVCAKNSGGQTPSTLSELADVCRQLAQAIDGDRSLDDVVMPEAKKGEKLPPITMDLSYLISDWNYLCLRK